MIIGIKKVLFKYKKHNILSEYNYHIIYIILY